MGALDCCNRWIPDTDKRGQKTSKICTAKLLLGGGGECALTYLTALHCHRPAESNLWLRTSSSQFPHYMNISHMSIRNACVYAAYGLCRMWPAYLVLNGSSRATPSRRRLILLKKRFESRRENLAFCSCPGPRSYTFCCLNDSKRFD